MKITVKKLQGEECTLEVQPEMYICDVKKKVYSHLNVPATEQKLLLNGKTLSDELTINSYPTIKEGTKINLIVKKREGLQEAATRVFRKHYKEPVATNIAKEFMKVLQKKFDAFSLDDIERLAISCINEEASGHE